MLNWTSAKLKLKALNYGLEQFMPEILGVYNFTTLSSDTDFQIIRTGSQNTSLCITAFNDDLHHKLRIIG